MKKAKTPLSYGKYANSPQAFQQNIKHMKEEGYSEKRAVGTAFGEADKALCKMYGNYDIKNVKKSNFSDL